MHIILVSVKSGFDFARGEEIADTNAKAQYVIFLVAFVFEDIGQILIQEMYRLSCSCFGKKTVT